MRDQKKSQFRKVWNGFSSDGRTNKRIIICSCGKGRWEPPTTRLATQYVECPKCGRGETINYNDEDETNGR